MVSSFGSIDSIAPFSSSLSHSLYDGIKLNDGRMDAPVRSYKMGEHTKIERVDHQKLKDIMAEIGEKRRNGFRVSKPAHHTDINFFRNFLATSGKDPTRKNLERLRHICDSMTQDEPKKPGPKPKVGTDDVSSKVGTVRMVDIKVKTDPSLQHGTIICKGANGTSATIKGLDNTAEVPYKLEPQIPRKLTEEEVDHFCEDKDKTIEMDKLRAVNSSLMNEVEEFRDKALQWDLHCARIAQRLLDEKKENVEVPLIKKTLIRQIDNGFIVKHNGEELFFQDIEKICTIVKRIYA